MKGKILDRLEKVEGKVGFYYKNLVSGEEWGYNEGESFLAASVIKLPMFMELSKRNFQTGGELMNTAVTVRESDKKPICGALTLFKGHVACDIGTLCRLMISLSDNTATNFLIDYLGLDEYDKGFSAMGLSGTRLRRKLFDREGHAKGLENTIVPAEIGMLLEKVYRGEFVNETVSDEIVKTLKLQQISHKIPGYLDGRVVCANKTGEDDNLSNDVGIVYAKEPFVVCFAGNGVRVSRFDELIREVSYELCRFDEKSRTPVG